MNITLKTFFIVAALICFILAALNIGGKVNLQAAGLALLTAALLFM